MTSPSYAIERAIHPLRTTGLLIFIEYFRSLRGSSRGPMNARDLTPAQVKQLAMQVQGTEMKKAIFEELLVSVKQAGAIGAGARASRTFKVDSATIKELRKRTRLSQPDFATLLGVQVSTLRNWNKAVANRQAPPRPCCAQFVTTLSTSSGAGACGLNLSLCKTRVTQVSAHDLRTPHHRDPAGHREKRAEGHRAGRARGRAARSVRRRSRAPVSADSRMMSGSICQPIQAPKAASSLKSP